jgi:hypothetical protein
MSECVEYREYNIRNPWEWLAFPLLVLIAFAGLVVTLKNWSWISNVAGILALLVFTLAAVDSLKRQLVVNSEGLRIRTLLRRRVKVVAWDSIEQVIVNRTRDGRAIRRVLIVGRHPGLPPEAAHREYDEKRGILFEPPGRRIIAVPGSAPDLPAMLQCLHDQVPYAFPNGV